MKKYLMMNSWEVLRAEKNDDGTFNYYVVSNDGNAMIKVETYQEFIEEMKKFAHICILSWNKELVEQYKELYNFVNDF